jgi:hypothetical protein
MLKKLLLLGVVSGLLAGIASVIYQRVYTASLGADFSKIAMPVGIVVSSVIGCVLASFGYWLLDKWMKGKADFLFNLIFAVLSFATILGPFAAKLPMTVDTPELFPGLTIPMHFFPIVGWLTLKPAFVK